MKTQYTIATINDNEVIYLTELYDNGHECKMTTELNKALIINNLNDALMTINKLNLNLEIINIYDALLLETKNKYNKSNIKEYFNKIKIIIK